MRHGRALKHTDHKLPDRAATQKVGNEHADEAGQKTRHALPGAPD